MDREIKNIQRLPRPASEAEQRHLSELRSPELVHAPYIYVADVGLAFTTREGVDAFSPASRLGGTAYRGPGYSPTSMNPHREPPALRRDWEGPRTAVRDIRQPQ
jgi:hypothetical protein